MAGLVAQGLKGKDWKVKAPVVWGRGMRMGPMPGARTWDLF